MTSRSRQTPKDQPLELEEGKATLRQNVPLERLQGATYNPRTISEPARKGLEQSLRSFGLVQPVVVNRLTGVIVGGHQRIDALRALGASHCTVVEVDLSDTEEKALNLVLNSPEVTGSWTPEAVGLLEEIATALPEVASALRVPALLGDLKALADSGEVPELAGGVTLDEDLAEQVEHVTCPGCGTEFPA